MQLAAARDRVWRGVADARRRLTRSGSAPTSTFEVSPRGDLDRWVAWSADNVERYRRQHPPAQGSVAVVCVSMRPEFAAAVAACVAGQRDVDLEFVFVANAPSFDGVDLDTEFRPIADVALLRPTSAVSLGAGLNMALAATDARFIAKFDDDDHYGPHHLADSLRAHGYAGAGVVGKHTYYAQLEATGERLLRFPGNEFRYSSTLAGGTLVIDRERTGDLAFDDVSLGEDRAFIAACHRRGVSTFAADRFNFVQSRRDDNTWRISDHAFAAGALSVSGNDPVHVVDR